MTPQLTYNPGFLGRDGVIAQFVAREREFARAMEDVRAHRVGHHVLVAGARGMGKTTLLQRIEAEVARAPALSAWLALKFPEEQYNVRTVADFWVNCLDAMADAFDSAGRSDDAHALDEAIQVLPADDAAREADALALLERHADGRHLLLLVDNLDLLAERIDGWQLRAVLSDPERDLTIVGATSGDALFTADYGKPFLDFFTIVPLDPLTFDEGKDLLHKLATRDAATGLLDLLDRDDGRFYGLFTLSGGNPRTLIQLYNVLSRPDAKDRDIEGDLEQLLDQVTPLYKAKFEQLPTQSQQVLDAVAIHWAPVLASDVAASMRMEVTQVSAQLSRLQRLGWVEKVERPDTSRSGYQVVERFFNVWYLVRTSRRMRKKLMLLAECLVVLHGKEAVADHARQALGDPTSRPELLLALSRCVEDAGLKRALDLDAVDRLAAMGDSPLPNLAAEFDDTPWYAAVENKLKLKRALRSLSRDQATVGRMIAMSPVPSAERQRMIDALVRNVEPHGWDDALWELRRIVACHGGDAAGALGSALAKGDLLDLADWDGVAALRHRGGADLERILRFESTSPGDPRAPDDWLLADASAGELIAWSRRAGSDRDLVARAFAISSAEAASAWWTTYPDAHAPFPPDSRSGATPAEVFVRGRALFEAGRFDEAADAFVTVAADAGGDEAFLRDQARIWQGIAWSYSFDDTRRQAAQEILSAVFWWTGPYAGPTPQPIVPTHTVGAVLVRSDFAFITDALTTEGAAGGAFGLLIRLHMDGRSLAPHDGFLAASLARPEEHAPMVIQSALRGHPVPILLTEAIGAAAGHVGTASLLMVLAGRWDRAAELARQVEPTDPVPLAWAAQAFDLALTRGQSAQLARFLSDNTTFRDRLAPYAAAADALAKGEARQLLLWPLEVQHAARAIVERFTAATQ